MYTYGGQWVVKCYQPRSGHTQKLAELHTTWPCSVTKSTQKKRREINSLVYKSLDRKKITHRLVRDVVMVKGAFFRAHHHGWDRMVPLSVTRTITAFLIHPTTLEKVGQGKKSPSAQILLVLECLCRLMLYRVVGEIQNTHELCGVVWFTKCPILQVF